jgi:uncharacterized repeat protein (TIGR01451 family)
MATEVLGAETDPSSNNSSTITPVPVSQTDLTVTTTKTTAPKQVQMLPSRSAGATMDLDATGVLHQMYCSLGYTFFVSASPSTEHGQQLTWTTVELSLAGTVTGYSSYGNATECMPTRNTAETDPSTGNNSSMIAPCGYRQPANGSNSNNNGNEHLNGSNVTSPITVSNNGPSDATGVSVSKCIAFRLYFVSEPIDEHG